MTNLEEMWFEAIVNGDVRTVKQCVNNGIDVNLQDCHGQTALIWACRERHNTIAQLLIETFRDEIDINIQDELGQSALILACEKSDTTMVRLLIENFRDSVDVNSQDEWGYTALIWAYKFSYMYIESIQLLIEHFKDVININLQDHWGQTLLSLACEYGDTVMVQLLIEHFKDKININLQDHKNRSPLDLAINNKHYDTAILLLPKDKYNETLIQACQDKNEGYVFALINHGADLYYENERGQSAMKVLRRKRELPPSLQNLKEKYLIEQTIQNQENSFAMGL